MFKLKDIFVSSLFFRAKSNASIFRMPQNHHEGAGEQVDKEQAPMDIDLTCRILWMMRNLLVLKIYWTVMKNYFKYILYST